MSNDNNKAPFDWQQLVNKAVWGLVVFLVWWGYQTHNRVTQLEDYEKTKSMFWQIHSQQRNAFNDLIDTINDRREPGEAKINRFRWDIDSDTE